MADNDLTFFKLVVWEIMNEPHYKLMVKDSLQTMVQNTCAQKDHYLEY